jgi:HEAT repeat protein
MEATEVDQPLTVEAGSVVVIHGDTWHRAMINFSADTTRYMLKFYFCRVQEPSCTVSLTSRPSWDHHNPAWIPVDGAGQDDDAAEATWRWLLGKAAVDASDSATTVTPAESQVPLELLAEDNEVPTERERVNAIFACARAAAVDPAGVGRKLLAMLDTDATKAAVEGILLEGYNHSTNEFRGSKRQSKACNPSGTNPADLDATHALAAAGAPVLSILLQALLRSESSPSALASPWWVRAAAATAIGSLGPLAAAGPSSRSHSRGVEAAVEALATALVQDDAIWVRRNCAESLGYVLHPDTPAATAKMAAAALVQALADCDDIDQLDDGFNYEQSEQYRETVRQAAATALCRAVANPAVRQLPGLTDALYAACVIEIPHKLNSVTQWSAAVALQRIGTEESTLLLDDALGTMGWRPVMPGPLEAADPLA